MRFSRDMVIEIIKEYSGSQFIDPDDNRQYSWVALLPDDASKMEEDQLYVCMLSEALKRNASTPGYHYVCIRDRFTNDDEADEIMRGIIVLNENRDVPWLLSLFQDRFLALVNWVQQMQESLMKNPDLQKLLDLSEPILKNFVNVLDASYALLAYTKNYIYEEPITTSLLEKGYHDEETMRHLKEQNRFKLYNESNGLIISKPGIMSRYETVGKLTRIKGVTVAHTVMMCWNTPCSKALIELFGILMYYIDLYFEKKIGLSQGDITIYSTFLHDIIYGDISSPHIIAERAKAVNLPYASNFDVFRIIFEDNSTVLVGRVVKELYELLHDSKIISENYEIIILNVYTAQDIREASKAKIETIRPLLEKYSALCGVSSKFTSLRELKHAYTQAVRAHGFGYKLQSLQNNWNFEEGIWEELLTWKDRRVFCYDDLYLYYIVSTAKTGAFDVIRNTYYDAAIERLIDYDIKQNSNLLQVLYCHLISERRATATGNLLHMHRNNVLYHISKVEEILGISLDDHMVRLNLLLSFYAREITVANKIETEA